MANKTINELTAASLPLDLTELLHIVQGGNSRQTSVGGLLGEIKWLSKPIGEPFPLWDHLAGCDIPPINSPNFRFIVLTAGKSGAGEYNEGILTSESVTGSAPLVMATATIDDVSSPLDGEVIHLINSERRFLRAGLAGTAQDDAFQGHWHNLKFGSTNEGKLTPQTNVSQGGRSSLSEYGGVGADIVTDGVNGSPRIQNETRGKNIGATYYMRVW